MDSSFHVPVILVLTTESSETSVNEMLGRDIGINLSVCPDYLQQRFFLLRLQKIDSLIPDYLLICTQNLSALAKLEHRPTMHL